MALDGSYHRAVPSCRWAVSLEAKGRSAVSAVGLILRQKTKLLAFADLGMEAIYEFEVQDMPVTVAVDTKGTSVHQTGPEEWSRRIAGIPILQ